MLITDDENLRDFARLSRCHGMTSGTWSRHLSDRAGYDIIFPGHNYRCTEITAALGLAQLAKLSDGNTRRRQITELYDRYLASSDAYQVVLPPPGQTMSACHIMSVVCADPAIRERAVAALTREEIQTSHHYTPISTFSWYEANGHTVGDLSTSLDFARRQITLPMYPALSDEHVREIADILLAAAQ